MSVFLLLFFGPWNLWRFINSPVLLFSLYFAFYFCYKWLLFYVSLLVLLCKEMLFIYFLSLHKSIRVNSLKNAFQDAAENSLNRARILLIMALYIYFPITYMLIPQDTENLLLLFCVYNVYLFIILCCFWLFFPTSFDLYWGKILSGKN